MRVLLVMTAREVGGAELYVEHLARALQGRAQFTIVLPDHPNLRAFTERLSAIAEMRPLPLDQPAQWARVTPVLRRLARAHDVIHLNSNHPGSRLGIVFGFALSGLPAPLVCVEQRASPLNDIRAPRALTPVLPAFFRLSRRGAACIIAVSRENAELLTRLYGIPPHQIEVVHNAAQLPEMPVGYVARERSAVRAELGLAMDDRLVLTLARLAPNKGHRYLVAAAPSVIERFPNTHFLFAGAQDDGATIERLAAQLNVRGHVHLLGFRTDTARLLAASDLFALPSLAEGMPLSVIEALAAGLPVVATRVGGIPEIVTSGENGLLVAPADSQALAHALLAMLGMAHETRERFCQAARRAAAQFTPEVMAERTLAVYRRAMPLQSRNGE